MGDRSEEKVKFPAFQNGVGLKSPDHHKQRAQSSPMKQKGIEDRLRNVMKAKAYRRMEVFCEHNQVGLQPMVEQDTIKHDEPLEVMTYPKSKADEKMILDCLQRNILFNEYSEIQLKKLMAAMKPRTIQSGTMPIIQGDFGHDFIVVVSGEFEFVHGSKSKPEEQTFAKRGDCFGELSLLFSSPRSVSVVCRKKANVFVLPRPIFSAILADDTRSRLADIIATLRASQLCSEIPDDQLRKLAKAGHYQTYKKGDLVFAQGSESLYFYFVISGAVEIQAIDHQDKSGKCLTTAKFGAGEYFGEMALLTHKQKRTADVVALENCSLLVLDKSTVSEYLATKSDVLKELDLNFENRLLKSVPFIKDLNDETFQDFRQSIERRTADKGKVIIKQGDEGNFFYIIKAGEVKVSYSVVETSQANEIFLGRGDFFGHLALMQPDGIGKANATISVESDSVSLFAISKANFVRLFESMEGKLKHKEAALSPTKNLVNFSAIYDADTRRTTDLFSERHISFHIKLADLKTLKMLGSGSYGKVGLVVDTRTEEKYALKSINKRVVFEKKQQQNILNEKRILQQCNSKFIVKLFTTFQDSTNVYFLLELVPGGDLFNYLHYVADDARVTEHDARFFIGCVIEALHSLHTANIAYRDLKQENLMIDEKGYLKLVDFGFSRIINGRSKTSCGTLEYMAPELVIQNGSGHNHSVDLWALGVLLYELVVGRSPFSATRDPTKKDQIKILRNITKVKYPKPDEISRLPDILEIVENLLKKSPVQRASVTALRTSPLFMKDGWSWNALFKQQMPPVWKPDLANDMGICFPDDDSEDGGAEAVVQAKRGSFKIGWIEGF